MVAIDDSASMLCARVMRGISSIDSIVTPAAAGARSAGRRTERIGEADHRLSGAERRVRRRGAHLQDDIRGQEHFGARHDGGALCTIRVVRKAGGLARRLFDRDLQAGFEQRTDRRGNQRDARLTWQCLLRDPDSHAAESLVDLRAGVGSPARDHRRSQSAMVVATSGAICRSARVGYSSTSPVVALTSRWFTPGRWTASTGGAFLRWRASSASCSA